ncbi:MAG: M28 family peptidase [Bacteroidales bacterium]|jgi:hypothetical protein|nr:M28 family peptidase [Bacteroidales bacterium]
MAKKQSQSRSIIRTDFFSRYFSLSVKFSKQLQNNIFPISNFGKAILIFAFAFLPFASFSQSYNYVNYCLDTLTSKTMSGRGYQDDADKKAATFIANELQANGVKQINISYFQPFDIQINNINSAVLKLHNKDSIKQIGVDFVVSGTSPSCDIELIKAKAIVFNSKSQTDNIKKDKLNNKVLIFNQDFKNKNATPLSYRDIILYLRELKKEKIVPKLVIIQGFDKIQYPISTSVGKYPTLLLKGCDLSTKIDYLHLTIEAKYEDKYQTQNVWAMVEGTQCKDSFFVFTAHYDHLGRVGEAYYPGAADNASGTSVVLDLARSYAQNPAEYSVLFIFFSGEEIGLLGSYYAAANPLIDLTKIKFLFNLDMCGTGSGGVAVINGQKERRAGELLQKINDENHYFLKVNLGEESCNSDHCPFIQKGVPAHFLFTYGCEYNEYHTIYDDGKELGFTKHLDFCNLLKEFVRRYR